MKMKTLFLSLAIGASILTSSALPQNSIANAATTDEELKDIMPTMSTYTSGDIKVSADTEFSSVYSAFRAFDDLNGLNVNDTVYVSTKKTGWLQVDFGKRTPIGSYSIESRNNSYQAGILQSPNTWTLQGSNDGTNFVTIDTHSAITWNNKEKKVFKLEQTENYRYYRIDVTANNGAEYWGVGEMEFYPGEMCKGYLEILEEKIEAGTVTPEDIKDARYRLTKDLYNINQIEQEQPIVK